MVQLPFIHTHPHHHHNASPTPTPTPKLVSLMNETALKLIDESSTLDTDHALVQAGFIIVSFVAAMVVLVLAVTVVTHYGDRCVGAVSSVGNLFRRSGESSENEGDSQYVVSL